MKSISSNDEDDDELFFEPLDRIPSTSGSETDEEDPLIRTGGQLQNGDDDNNFGQPSSIMAGPNYQVWISEPEPVHERRKRLLQQMGLGSDRGMMSTTTGTTTTIRKTSSPEDHGAGVGVASSPSSSSVNSSSSSNDDDDDSVPPSPPSYSTAAPATTNLPFDTQGDVVRSVSCKELSKVEPSTTTTTSSSSNMARSRSDGAATADNCANPTNIDDVTRASAQPHISSSSAGTSSKICDPHDCGDHYKERHHHEQSQCSPSASSSNIQAKNGEQDPARDGGGGGVRPHSRCSSIWAEGSHASIDYDEEKDLFCKIKNLDNGKEFIIEQEPREEGTLSNRLRDMETGRQLTIEEFQMTVGHSPIVQELMRREKENVEASLARKDVNSHLGRGGSKGSAARSKKKGGGAGGGGWFKSIKVVATAVTGGYKERRSSDEKDTSSEKGEKGGRRSSSATDDSQDVQFNSPERTRVRQYGKACKELSALYMSQEIHAHKGCIWTIKFSLDGLYLASAGEDCVIHLWQVIESERKSNMFTEKQEDANGSPETASISISSIENHPEKKKRGKMGSNRKSTNADQLLLPNHIFVLSDKPVCSFIGHLDDVLDLSWSKSQYLLSSSMDKTVRLWHMSTNSCLKMFSHTDYVTCIQFNPVDDRYFISGSLDAMVRIWNIPERKVVDWSDVNEMVTAACYTPDGESAFVGSHKGSCRIYKTSGNKLQQENQLDVLNKKKKSQAKKITGFQFAPGSSSEVLITSADSRVRVFDGVNLVHKFKGFRNTSSQIAASFSVDGKYVICASEDSHVYLWRHDCDTINPASTSKTKNVVRSYEHFHCRGVSVAIPWLGMPLSNGDHGSEQDSICMHESEANASLLRRLQAAKATASLVTHLPLPPRLGSASIYACPSSPSQRINGQETISSASASPLPSPGNSISSNNSNLDVEVASLPSEDKLGLLDNPKNLMSSSKSNDGFDGKTRLHKSATSAWGLVIVTAGLGGEIRTFQNFGVPLKL